MRIAWRKDALVVLYLIVFLYTIGVMKWRMPLYGFVRVALGILFVADFFIWRIFRTNEVLRSGKWHRRVSTGFYFLPFFLLVLFCIRLSFQEIHTWPPFWRTYLPGGILILLSTHFCYGSVWIILALSGFFGRSGRTEKSGEVRHKAAGIVSCLLFFVLIYAMVVSTFNLRLDRINLRQTNPERPIPEGLRGYRVLQLSDLHIGSFTSARQIRSLVLQVLQTRPDMVVFTGDMVNFGTSEMTPFLSELAHLQAPDGVYCVLGNHDYGNYRAWPDTLAKHANLQKMLQYYQRLGWHCLNNASVKIERGGDTLYLVGVENWGKGKRFPKNGNLQKALAVSSVIEVRPSRSRPSVIPPDPVPASRPGYPHGDPREYTVLLSHDPSHFDSVVYLRYPQVDLTLSGHTHGMQLGLRIKGKDYSPARFVYEHYSGMYVMANGQALYVNTGCGFNGLPFRLGIRPNLTLFEF